MRAKVLEILDHHTASPAQIASQLGIGVSHVSYHVKVLREFECIELVAKKKRRGATEHRYRAVARPFFCDEAWRQIPPTSRQGIADALLKTIGEEASEALRAGTLGSRHDSHLSRSPLALDETGWRDITKLLEDTLEGVLAIREESATRLAEEGGPQIDAKLAILHFEAPPTPPQAGSSDPFPLFSRTLTGNH